MVYTLMESFVWNRLAWGWLGHERNTMNQLSLILSMHEYLKLRDQIGLCFMGIYSPWISGHIVEGGVKRQNKLTTYFMYDPKQAKALDRCRFAIEILLWDDGTKYATVLFSALVYILRRSKAFKVSCQNFLNWICYS